MAVKKLPQNILDGYLIDCQSESKDMTMERRNRGRFFRPHEFIPTTKSPTNGKRTITKYYLSHTDG